MTQDQVINRIAWELAQATGGTIDDIPTYRYFIRQALDIGINHFTKDMEEVVMLTRDGEEISRYKGVTDCSIKTGIRQSDISSVLTGVQKTAGGYRFIKAKDQELIPRRDLDPDV